MTARPYPDYRPSGVPWLGDVPGHWGVDRLKGHVANVVNQTAERPSGDIYIALEHVRELDGDGPSRRAGCELR